MIKKQNSEAANEDATSIALEQLEAALEARRLRHLETRKHLPEWDYSYIR